MLKKISYNSFIVTFTIIQLMVLTFGIIPTQNTSQVNAAVPLTDMYDTLSNSRFSFKGALGANVSASQNFATLGTSTAFPDRDTGNLFPGDVICFNGSAGNGCIDNNTKTVTNIPVQATGTTFNYTAANTATMNSGDYVVATQSAVHTITFKPATSVTAGKFVVKIPANTTSPTDGIPDADGFDTRGTTNGFPAALTAISGATGQYTFAGAGPTITAATLATATGFHTFTFTFTGTLSSATTYTLTLGNSESTDSKYVLINPAPSGTTHTRGVADSYSVQLYTCDSTCTTNIFDNTTVKVDPVDGVLVSALVEQALSFTITGENAVTACGVASAGRATTTATTVPFGSIISSTQFYNGTQKLKVVTNSPDGYVVTVKEDGVMTSGANTIPNTACDAGGCSSGTQAEWNTSTITSTNQGLGFSLQNATGTDASFLYNDSSRSFSAQPFSATAYQLMSNAAPTSNSEVYVCYRLGVLGTQTPGFYYNKLTYVATPRY